MCSDSADGESCVRLLQIDDAVPEQSIADLPHQAQIPVLIPQLRAGVHIGRELAPAPLLEALGQRLVGLRRGLEALEDLLVVCAWEEEALAFRQQTDQHPLLEGFRLQQTDGVLLRWGEEEVLEEEAGAAEVAQADIDVCAEEVVLEDVLALEVERVAGLGGDEGIAELVFFTEDLVGDVLDGCLREGVDVLVEDGESLPRDAGVKTEAHEAEVGGGEGAGGGVEAEHGCCERGEVPQAEARVDVEGPFHQSDPLRARIPGLHRIEACEEQQTPVHHFLHLRSILPRRLDLCIEGDEVGERIDGGIEQVEDVLLVDGFRPGRLGELVQALDVLECQLVVLFGADLLFGWKGQYGGDEVGHGSWMVLLVREVAEIRERMMLDYWQEPLRIIPVLWVSPVSRGSNGCRLQDV